MNSDTRWLIAHLAAAVAKYAKDAEDVGHQVPPELPLIAVFLTDAASRRPEASPVEERAEGWDAVPMATNTPNPAILLTLREAADLLRVSERTLARRVASGALVAVRIGRSTRVRREDLDAFVASLAGPKKFKDNIETKEPA